jgi:uncharacterized membrane protein YbhN (UPF0104 family)
MQNAMIAAGRTIRRRIGWNRLGFALSLLIIAVAAVTLHRVLADVELAKVVDALRATPAHAIAVAAVLVVAAYFTLTFYDFFSLRTVGHAQVPYAVAAFASFTSFTIGHNVGAMVLTGGAVRFRIYSAWGLTVVDIAKIAFVTGLTFWLGNAFLLGLCMIHEPAAATAVDQLPPGINRAIGVAGLASIAGYLVWVGMRPRVVGVHDIRIRLPGAPLTLVQIAIGVLDLSLTSLAMYALLPPAPAIDFFALLVIFVLATLLGFISHAPGALGVFDAAMLVALPQFEKEALLAALLLFRLLYYVIPFALALALLGIRELIVALPRGHGKFRGRA